MKTWIKRTLFGLLAGTVVLGGLAACGQRNFHHGWHAMSESDVAQFKTRMVERVGSKLDLDAAQKAKLGVLADRLHEQRMALAAGTADPRAELQSLIAGPAFDRAKAGALLQDKLAAVQGKSPEVLAALADFYDSLKPEQQTQVRDFMARRGHRG